MIDCSYINCFDISLLMAQCLSKGVLKRDKKSLKQILTAAHRNSSLLCVSYTAVVRSSAWLLARFSLHMTVM